MIWCTLVRYRYALVDDAHFSVKHPLTLCVIVCRDRTKAALVKNIKITNNQLTDEQIEEKIDNNDISVFSSAIIQVLIVGVPTYRTKSKAFLLCSGCEMRSRMAHPDPGGKNDPQRRKQGFGSGSVSGSVSGSGSAWIRINLSCWIRIRIRIQIPDPDPGGQK
jgi:hypothetical protein